MFRGPDHIAIRSGSCASDMWSVLDYRALIASSSRKHGAVDGSAAQEPIQSVANPQNFSYRPAVEYFVEFCSTPNLALAGDECSRRRQYVTQPGSHTGKSGTNAAGSPRRH